MRFDPLRFIQWFNDLVSAYGLRRRMPSSSSSSTPTLESPLCPDALFSAELKRHRAARVGWNPVPTGVAGFLGWTERSGTLGPIPKVAAWPRGSWGVSGLVGPVGYDAPSSGTPLGPWCLTAVGRQSLGGLRFGTL